jgi:hypothetical protein
VKRSDLVDDGEDVMVDFLLRHRLGMCYGLDYVGAKGLYFGAEDILQKGESIQIPEGWLLLTMSARPPFSPRLDRDSFSAKMLGSFSMAQMGTSVSHLSKWRRGRAREIRYGP